MATEHGSDAWTSAREFLMAPGVGADPDYKQHMDFLYKRATDFDAHVDWNAVLATAQRLRGGEKCMLVGGFSVGAFNLVRRIKFEGGVSWVIRARMPSFGGVAGVRDMLPPGQIIRIQVAAMKFLKQKTTIPVPELYYYDTDPNNEIGAPYILMQYYHASTAQKLLRSRRISLEFGELEEEKHLARQMAEIQVELSSFQFDKIGGLYIDEATGEFYIGPEHDTGKGPWASTIDFYWDYTNFCMEATILANRFRANQDSFINPVLCNHALRYHDDPTRRNGPFYLTNRDFGPHNVLVDADFNILAVIDLDSVMAAPLEVAAQNPFTETYGQGPPRWLVEPNLSIPRLQLPRPPKFLQYAGLIKDAEKRWHEEKGRTGLLTDAVMSNSAMIFSGLREYKRCAKEVNELWMRTYIHIIRIDNCDSANSTVMGN